MRVLVVDDDAAVVSAMRRLLRSFGCDVDGAACVSSARAKLASNACDVALVDVCLGRAGDRSGLEVLRICVEHDIPAAAFTGSHDPVVVRDAHAAGARHVFLKVVDSLDLVAGEITSLVNRGRASDKRNQSALDQLVGGSEAMRALRAQIKRVAAARIEPSVLITGPSGAGKELVARAIHSLSNRRGPFEAMVLGERQSELVVSELFGHVKGAFTGAVGNQVGIFERARNGTVLLDEIGDVPLELQPKLLRVLESREARRVGGQVAFTIDVRVLAATHVNLEAAVAAGRFRRDLFERLNALSIRVPSLHERREDIAAIATHLAGGMGFRLTEGALAWLATLEYPGNVRTLRNRLARLSTMERALIDETIARDAIEREREPEAAPATLRAAERSQLLAALARAQGNKSEAARMLGLPRPNLYRKLKRHGIDEAS